MGKGVEPEPWPQRKGTGLGSLGLGLGLNDRTRGGVVWTTDLAQAGCSDWLPES